MNYEKEKAAFMERVKTDQRLSPSHVSIFDAVLYLGSTHEYENPVKVKAREIMPFARIGTVKTYYRLIGDLHRYGYIRYQASYDPRFSSLVYIY